MIVVGVLLIALLLLLVIILQVRAYYILKRQHKIISEQSVEIHKQNQVLAIQNQQLNELNVEKQQIIGLVSHDLKGPFNRIFALVQLMNMSGENLTDEQREYIGKIHYVAVDGLNMVRNLLDSRKLEEKLFETELTNILLEPVISSFIKNYKAIAGRKKIELEWQCPTGVFAEVDRLFLNRILDNLISNAIKFSPSGKKVVVWVEEKNDTLYLNVKDEGPGISVEDQKKLFLKFQKLSAKPTAGESSTGLGLSIVKTLTEKMGGSIACESELGKGSNFIVTLKRSYSNK